MISINEADARPPYEQIREQLTDQIRSGELLPGHRLPSVRQLAADLGIAAGTVARAYTELEADGMLESSRATGTRVRAVEELSPAAREAARAYIRSLAGSPVSLDDAIRAVRIEWR